METIFEVIVVLVSAFVQGLTSFGFSIVAIPFLLRTISLQEIVPIITLLALGMNIPIIISFRKHIKFRKFVLLVLAGILFVPVGAYSLKYLNTNYLKLFFGVLITAFSLLLFLKKTFPIKREKAGYVITGLLSGFLNGSLSLSGPPVVLFLSNQGVNKDTLRANITLYFMILNIITALTFLSTGLMTQAVLEKTLYLMPALLAGIFAGIKAYKKLNEDVFKRVVLIMLVGSGVWTTISTLIDMIKSV